VLETDKKEEQSYGNILMQSYEKLKELKEEAAAKMLDAYGLPPDAATKRIC
jgi:alanyl-tRNA synthetase